MRVILQFVTSAAFNPSDALDKRWRKCTEKSHSDVTTCSLQHGERKSRYSLMKPSFIRARAEQWSRKNDFLQCCFKEKSICSFDYCLLFWCNLFSNSLLSLNFLFLFCLYPFDFLYLFTPIFILCLRVIWFENTSKK